MSEPQETSEQGRRRERQRAADTAPTESETLNTDIAIVGIGMHEFGRNPEISGMDQGVVAVRRAL